MNTNLLRHNLPAVTAAFLLSTFAACGGAPLPGHSGITVQSRMSCPYLLGDGGTTYLQLQVVTPDLGRPHRRPLNLAIVLDRSGSMGSEQKIEHARAAVRALVDQLDSDDLLTLVIYDDVVEVLRRSAPVGNKEVVKRLIDEVYPRGSTDLGGGLMEGYRQVERHLSRGYVNRVILLSDGLANRGIVDPEELTSISSRHRRDGISLTSVGVGLEYNENLMVGLAECGGGSYYFVEHARHLASMFRREFNAMASLVAQNATLVLTLTPHVRVLDVIGGDDAREGYRHEIALGDLYANERREITVVLQMPSGKGHTAFASAHLEYATEGNTSASTSPISIAMDYTSDRDVVEKHRDAEIEARSQVASSTREVENALKALDRGDKSGAVSKLQEMERALAASPTAAAGGAAGAMIHEQEMKIKAYADSLSEDGANISRAKKAIQYDNYRVQKQK
jgi:Ca-activated chloride channel homolog